MPLVFLLLLDTESGEDRKIEDCKIEGKKKRWEIGFHRARQQTY